MATKTLDIQKILNENFLSRPEAAIYLDVSERTLERWIKLNAGPPVVLIRKKPFFERAALAEFKRKRKAVRP